MVESINHYIVQLILPFASSPVRSPRDLSINCEPNINPIVYILVYLAGTVSLTVSNSSLDQAIERIPQAFIQIVWCLDISYPRYYALQSNSLGMKNINYLNDDLHRY